MKKLVIVGGLGILSFLAGVAGLYVMMPSVNPTLVEETKLTLDSLGLITIRGADSLRAVRDSLRATADSSALAVEARTDHADVDLADSLAITLSRLSSLERENEGLAREIERLTERLKEVEDLRVDAESMSATLSKLDDRQLRPILENLDTKALERLYVTASARNQARLLQAMPPDRAAQFIRTLVKGSPTSESASTPTQRVADTPSQGGTSGR